jgi:hypothetical protein
MGIDMGGLGSGTWIRGDTKPKIEHLLHLDVRQLCRKKCLRPGLSFSMQWWRGDVPALTIWVDVRPLSLLFSYQYTRGGELLNVEETVYLSWTPCHYGGKRPWLICPGCGKRVAVLIVAASLLRCRLCLDLKYRCQSKSPLDRARRKRVKLQKCLGAETRSRHCIPEEKPKGMHQKTFVRLCDRLDEAKRQEIKALINRFSYLLRNDEQI